MVPQRSIYMDPAWIDSPRQPDHDDIAEFYGLHRTTEWRHETGRTRPRDQFISESSRLLSDAQEEEVLAWIEKMTLRGMPPTPAMLRGTIECIVGRPLGEKWISRFCQRHAARITSVYLRNIDNLRHAADNSAHFEHFFKLVSHLFYFPLANTFT